MCDISNYTQASLGSGGGGVTVNEVFEAGSLGQGTAVRGDFDVDLVIYSTSKRIPFHIHGCVYVEVGKLFLLLLLLQVWSQRKC